MYVLFFGLYFVAVTSVAYAAGEVVVTPPSTTTVFFGNVLTAVLSACVPVVAAIASAALWKLFTRLGFQATAQNKANLEADLQTALAFGVAREIPEIKAKGWDHLDVHNAIIAHAINFMLQRFPDRSAALASPTIPQDVAVMESLTARLPEAMAIAAASPATPPAPPIIVPAEPIAVVPATSR